MALPTAYEAGDSPPRAAGGGKCHSPGTEAGPAASPLWAGCVCRLAFTAQTVTVCLHSEQCEKQGLDGRVCHVRKSFGNHSSQRARSVTGLHLCMVAKLRS